MNIKLSTKNALNKFINKIKKRNINGKTEYSKSSFIARKMLLQAIKEENINTGEYNTKEFNSPEDYLLVIYLLLLSYDVYDQFSKINKNHIYDYLKKINNYNLFNINITELFNEIYCLNPDIEKDKEIILLIDNLAKKRNIILNNIIYIENKMNKNNLFLNDVNTGNDIYDTLKNYFKFINDSDDDKKLAVIPSSNEAVAIIPPETLSLLPTPKQILYNDDDKFSLKIRDKKNDDDDNNKLLSVIPYHDKLNSETIIPSETLAVLPAEQSQISYIYDEDDEDMHNTSSSSLDSNVTSSKKRKIPYDDDDDDRNTINNNDNSNSSTEKVKRKRKKKII